jgi:hypothetical protein
MIRRASRSPAAARPAPRPGSRAAGDVDTLEQVEETRQRVVAGSVGAATVVDHVQRDLALLLSILVIGRILAACTMAESSPALTHSLRNTEFSVIGPPG